ncbi:MAG: hypothetical protein QXD88_01185 [Candidatus Anstonellales archaeon]
MSKKNLDLKLWLISKNKSRRLPPVFVRIKTNLKAYSPTARRNWRYSKLNTYYIRKRLMR